MFRLRPPRNSSHVAGSATTRSVRTGPQVQPERWAQASKQAYSGVPGTRPSTMQRSYSSRVWTSAALNAAATAASQPGHTRKPRTSVRPPPDPISRSVRQAAGPIRRVVRKNGAAPRVVPSSSMNSTMCGRDCGPSTCRK